MGNKMKDWLEKNQEVYNKFKSKIHSTLDLLSQNGTDVAECDDTDSLQNMLLEAMAAKGMPAEDLISSFSKAAEEDKQTESLYPAFCQRTSKMGENEKAERSEPIYK